jgi:hypothetical protein
MNRESSRNPLPFYGRGRLDGPKSSRVRAVRSAVAATAQKVFISLLLFFSSPVHPQDDLSFATPTSKDFYILIDSNVEDPPRYNGRGAIPRPAEGDSIEFQIFMPDAAGLEAYSFQLAF